MLVPTLSLLALVGGGSPTNLRNGGFESSTPGEFWQVDKSEAKQAFSIRADRTVVKEGQQSLLIAADQPARLTLRQDVFLPGRNALATDRMGEVCSIAGFERGPCLS